MLEGASRGQFIKGYQRAQKRARIEARKEQRVEREQVIEEMSGELLEQTKPSATACSCET